MPGNGTHTHTHRCGGGNGIGITSYQVAVLELEELLDAFVLVDRIVVGNDTFPVLDSLGMRVSKIIPRPRQIEWMKSFREI